MEEQQQQHQAQQQQQQRVNLLTMTHLLQHTLRSLCTHHNSQWVYAVFWRILPRNYPPPKWENQGGSAFDRSRGNWRNWILVWEDGFCNFAASSSTAEEMDNAAGPAEFPFPIPIPTTSSLYHHHENCELLQLQSSCRGLQPELFFKMSHEIYNYGEGLIGKVAADRSHKWIYKDDAPNENQDIKFLPTWQNSADTHPRTWEAQFQSGIKTIALIAVKEGVVQMGAVQKVIEDLSLVVQLRKKFSYIESIPGVLLPHPLTTSSIPSPLNMDAASAAYDGGGSVGADSSDLGRLLLFHSPGNNTNFPPAPSPLPSVEQLFYNNNNNLNYPQLKITPSMSSLEALLAKLPSVVPPQPRHHHPHQTTLELLAMEKVAKVEMNDDEDDDVVYTNLLRRYHECDITSCHDQQDKDHGF